MDIRPGQQNMEEHKRNMKGSKLMPKLEIPGEKHIIGQQKALDTGHEIAIRVAQSKVLRNMEDFRVTLERGAMAGQWVKNMIASTLHKFVE
jgi:hypothetical protein